jgi:transcriptional regulator with XRE-family HTH domain
LGDHLRKRRLDLGLSQRLIAKQMGVNPGTVVNWECNATSVALNLIPGVLRFLSYTPLPPGQSLPERLKVYRRTQGLSQKKLAGRLGVNESTVARWEGGQSQPSQALSLRLGSLLPPALGEI